MESIHYYWYYKRSSKKKNFGDDFNRNLFRFLGDRLGLCFFDISQKSALRFVSNNIAILIKSPSLLLPAFKQRYTCRAWLGIGSVLSSSGQKGKIIFGSGLIGHLGKPVSRNQLKDKTLLLRGLKTKNELGLKNADIALGDPGLLASLIYSDEPVTIRHEILVILHYTHIEKKRHVMKAFQGVNVKVISAENTPEYVAAMIKKSRYVVSSSLHGIIFAHSFGVKAVRMKFVDLPLKGGDFKWNDYLSIYQLGETDVFGAYDLDDLVVRLKSDIFLDHWAPSKADVREIQKTI